MKNYKKFLVIIYIIIFLLGLYYVCSKPLNTRESFDNKNKSYKCPNLLLRKNDKYLLYNTDLAEVPGVNPIQFNSLEDYTEFMQWQKSQKIYCPILYVQESTNAQGDIIYQNRLSPYNTNNGLPTKYVKTEPVTKLVDAGRDDPPFNQKDYPAYDPQDQYVGLNTPLDNMYNSNSTVSASAMDPNWGGTSYSQNTVESGYYSEDEVHVDEL